MSFTAAAATVWVVALPLIAVVVGLAVRSWHGFRATQSARWTAECRPYETVFRSADCLGARRRGATTPARKPKVAGF